MAQRHARRPTGSLSDLELTASDDEARADSVGLISQPLQPVAAMILLPFALNP